MKRNKSLIQAIDKFSLIENNLPEKAYYNKACAYSLLNEKENAIIWLEKFLSINKTVSKSKFLSEEDFNNIKSSDVFINLLNKYYPN